MIRLSLTTRDGRERTLETKPGLSLMEAIRDAGVVEGDFGLCGGCCACCSCHVYIEEADRRAILPPVTENEADLLEFSDARKPQQSRLACQIPLEQAMDGMRVVVAPED